MPDGALRVLFITEYCRSHSDSRHNDSRPAQEPERCDQRAGQLIQPYRAAGKVAISFLEDTIVSCLPMALRELRLSIVLWSHHDIEGLNNHSPTSSFARWRSLARHHRVFCACDGARQRAASAKGKQCQIGILIDGDGSQITYHVAIIASLPD